MNRNVYGPVPSRRLGKSLGINNIPYKTCTYSCDYCQLGKAVKMQTNRQDFYDPRGLGREVKTILGTIQNQENYPDYLTIVPDGEPTLDINLGALIHELKSNHIPVAVITNASLIDRPDVQADLLQADYISVKADTVFRDTWRKLNHPHKTIIHHELMKGMQSFAKQFTGTLVTETMLIDGLNDSFIEMENAARFIQTVNPDTAFISIPTRPPACKDISPAGANAITAGYQIFSEYIRRVELLTGYEGNAFSSSGNFSEDMLSITAVHPMRSDAVEELLNQSGSNADALDALLQERLLEKTQYNGHAYYLRKFKKLQT